MSDYAYSINPVTGNKTWRADGSVPTGNIKITKDTYDNIRYDKGSGRNVATSKKAADEINLKSGAMSNTVQLASGKYVAQGSRDDDGTRYGDAPKTAGDVIRTARERYGENAPISAIGYYAMATSPQAKETERKLYFGDGKTIGLAGKYVEGNIYDTQFQQRLSDKGIRNIDVYSADEKGFRMSGVQVQNMKSNIKYKPTQVYDQFFIPKHQGFSLQTPEQQTLQDKEILLQQMRMQKSIPIFKPIVEVAKGMAVNIKLTSKKTQLKEFSVGAVGGAAYMGIKTGAKIGLKKIAPRFISPPIGAALTVGEIAVFSSMAAYRIGKVARMSKDNIDFGYNIASDFRSAAGFAAGSAAMSSGFRQFKTMQHQKRINVAFKKVQIEGQHFRGDTIVQHTPYRMIVQPYKRTIIDTFPIKQKPTGYDVQRFIFDKPSQRQLTFKPYDPYTKPAQDPSTTMIISRLQREGAALNPKSYQTILSNQFSSRGQYGLREGMMMSGIKGKITKQTKLDTLYYPELFNSRFQSNNFQLAMKGMMDSGFAGKRPIPIKYSLFTSKKGSARLSIQPQTQVSDKPISLLSQRPSILRGTNKLNEPIQMSYPRSKQIEFRIASLIQSSSQNISNVVLSKQSTTPISIQSIQPMQMQSFNFAQGQSQSLKQTQIQTRITPVSLKTQNITTTPKSYITPPPRPPSLPPRIRPPRIPPPPKIPPSFDLNWFPKSTPQQKRKKKKQMYMPLKRKYTPTLTAIVGGISAPRIRMRGLTGLEQRPIKM